MLLRYSFAFAIFLSSFLIFQIQPIMTKIILPWFGGSPSVWTISILFFQLILLMGYLYSHLLTSYFGFRKGLLIHIALLLISCITLPIFPDSSLKYSTSYFVELRILIVLFKSVSVPYFLLSASSPLLQKWFSRIYTDESPYYLYAISNLGSLLGLASYPFIFEPLFGLKEQTHYWAGLHILYIILCICMVIKILFLKIGPESNMDRSEGIVKLDKSCWFLFSFFGVVLMLSLNNEMTQDFPPIPFLWVLTLGLYLLTFIYSFSLKSVPKNNIWEKTFNISLVSMIILKYLGHAVPIGIQIFIYCFVLLNSCMICHLVLAKLKPDKSYLTEFYLILSLGGVAGSFFVTFIGPLLFDQYYELSLTLFIIYIYLGRENITLKVFNFGKTKKILWITFGLIFLGSFIFKDILGGKNIIYKSRNFYGTLNVFDIQDGQKGPQRILLDGKTLHGVQNLERSKQYLPTHYYKKGSGVWTVFDLLPSPEGKKIGIIGLGAGTLSIFGHVKDKIDFYEINPDVIEIANKHFTFLKNAKSKINIVLGDARIKLEEILMKEGPLEYDIIVLDAFSSDVIPMHLLTNEALGLYKKHLSKNGVLVIHISNQHIDLFPIIDTFAKSIGFSSYSFSDVSSGNKEKRQSIWAIVTKNKTILENFSLKKYAPNIKRRNKIDVIWTDDYSNLLEVIKIF